MKQNVEAVLWDLDGVLVDTGEMHFLAFQTALPKFGISITLDEFKVIFGMANREALAYLTGHPLEESLVVKIDEAKETAFRGFIRGRAKTLPGVMEWLEYFKANQIRQAIASSAPQANIDALMDELNLRGYFDQILSAPENRLPSKPDPAVFLEAARRLGVDPAKSIVIEDSVAGIEAAKQAGMRCIAVTTTNKRERLLMADEIVDSLTSIEKEWFIPVRN